MRVAGRAGIGRRSGLLRQLGFRVRSTGRFRARGGRRLRRARRLGVLALAVVMIPSLMGAGTASGQAPVPTAAGIRGAVVHLMDWVTGKTPPRPGVPQQAAGKAPGNQTQVPAAVTRAVARATGRARARGAGQLPAYAFPAAKVRQHVTGTAGLGGPASYSPATSTPIPSGSSAASSLYRNADGSYTRLESPTGASGPGTLTFSGPSGVGVKSTYVTSASLQVLETWPGQCPATATVNVTDASGRQVGHWAGKPPASACGNGSGGGWVSVPISAAGLRTLGSQADAQLTVTPFSAAASVAPSATASATPPRPRRRRVRRLPRPRPPPGPRPPVRPPQYGDRVHGRRAGRALPAPRPRPPHLTSG